MQILRKFYILLIQVYQCCVQLPLPTPSSGDECGSIDKNAINYCSDRKRARPGLSTCQNDTKLHFYVVVVVVVEALCYCFIIGVQFSL